MTILHFHLRQATHGKKAMKFLVLFLMLPDILLTSAMEDNDTTLENSNFTEFTESDFNFTHDFTEENLGNTSDMPLLQYQDISNLRVYKGPLPKFPGTTANPWVALHSPVQMYIPIRNTGDDSEESEDCIQCPRNLFIYLSPLQSYIKMPVPTISICSSFARRSGRVHVAVVSGPRPTKRLYAGRHLVELMVWKAEGPVHSCKYTILVKDRKRVTIPPKKSPCLHPDHPSDGILLCVGNNKKYYPHDSVCQIFCPPNYLVENTSRNSSTIICTNGQWSPGDQVTCIAEFCSDLPYIGEHSYWNCNVEDSTQNFRNGTRCSVNCATGYVVPSSQSEKDIICNPPAWDNLETIASCKRAYLPRLRFCQNRHLYVRPGQFIKISSFLLPKGSSHADAPLTPVCSLQGKNLPKGKHENICEVTDTELKTTRKCSYQIHVEENSGPYPHAGDCKNRTIFVNRKGSFYLKPARFLIKIGQPIRTKVLQSKCKPKGDLGIGKHFIVCKATDPDTKITSTCSYWINVQKKTCPPLQLIPNGEIMCSSYEVGSICHYICDRGYSFVGKNSTKIMKTCQPNRRWQPPSNPVCEISVPILIDGCNNTEIQMNSSENFTVPVPRFLTSFNETLNVSCTPHFIKTVGLQHVLCKAHDDVFNTSCQFNVTVLLRDKLTTETLPLLVKDEHPQLIDGCDNVEVNQSTPIHYKIPLPRYLTASNETLNVSCLPILVTTAGQHQITCKNDNGDYNVSCHFNVSIYMEEELMLSFSEKVLDFQLTSGCNDIEVNVSSSINFTVPQPEYQSSSNDTIFSSCVPSFINTTGRHEVNCTVDNEAFNTSCQFNVIVIPQDEATSLMSSEKGSCKPLKPPLHSSIQCMSHGQTEICQMTCDPGFGFAEVEDDFLSVECSGDPEGLWKLQNFVFNDTLPDCLPQLEGSAAEVWISFEAFTLKCGEELQEQINILINELCEEGTNCSKIFINCTLDEESDMMLMVVNWTVQADFIDEENYDYEEIPEAEIRLESVMEKTRQFLASGNAPEEIHLFRDSFRKGFITLVCPSGFIPNTLMSKCVRCPKEMETC